MATTSTTYAITVSPVVGGANKYHLDGNATPHFYFETGASYTFDQSESSNNGHPLRISETADGTHGGGTEFLTGVDTSESTKTTIVVPSGTSTLYYYCQNHPGMGGTISVTTTKTLTFTNETEILFRDENGTHTDVFTGAQLKSALQLAEKLGIVEQPAVNRDITTLLYRGILGRAPDAGGRDLYEKMFNAKEGSVAGVAQAMLESAEYGNKANDGEDDDALVERLYTSVLGRSPTDDEKEHMKKRRTEGTAHIGIAALVKNGARE